MAMKYFIGDQQVVADDEALELALDLYWSPGEETSEECAARWDAGRDLLDEDPELFDRAARVVAEALAPAKTPRESATVLPLPARRDDGAEGVAA